MTKNSILQAAQELVFNKLQTDSSGHDWWHIVRVRNMACQIALQEKADLFICELTALLHDMADEKLNSKPDQALEDLETWLKSQALADKDRQHVLQIIETMSFKGSGKTVPATLEGKIVQDADRLDAIGAIGIARCMVYSGHKGRLIHNPELSERQDLPFSDYHKGSDTALMHFYEKLLKLKDLMNTAYARKIAEHRHAFLEAYLTEFYAEWNGDK